MSERLPEPQETLDTYLVHGRSLNQWYDWLTTDQRTGEATGHLKAPCSRYGRTGGETAWYALACEVIFTHANGEEDDPKIALDYYQGLAVNDHEDVASLINDYWYVVPDCLRDYLGTQDDIQQLMDGEEQ
jgi:hypothetical protein